MLKKRKSTIGIQFVLFIIFTILKITNNIDWSWTWVTSPLWIPLATFLTLIIMVFITGIIITLFGINIDKLKDKIKSED